ncbi:Hypothetical protein SRAE_2000322500 [Strongyloides ratti]|uniref:Uncharacterized protein n=1 Tax=Strongyloides ratti TaxID=34506 RepID=A0A090MZA0_STRRB|nr:Hypothetical protein SRAE_2000322500 [Strongyloides ratti]CEF68569.1 Hypothetical protein SRAE_2000322500 [Strongyloides ratti]
MYVIFIIILLTISVIQNVVDGKYLQNDKIGIFKHKSTFNDNFNNNIDKIDKDVLSLTRILNEIKEYSPNSEEINYDTIIPQRVPKNIKTREDSDNYSHLHISRCYFNPVSC